MNNHRRLENLESVKCLKTFILGQLLFFFVLLKKLEPSLLENYNDLGEISS